VLNRFRTVAGVLLLAVAASGCTPRLDAVYPNRGYPRQLLAVQGETALAGVVWDVGKPGEKVLYNGLFGTQYFQIPSDAVPGTYDVALRNGNGTSSSLSVTVLPAAGTFPAPRIEDIALFGVAGAGPYDLLLTVSAANLDVDATVAVTETVGGAAPVPKAVPDTIRWGALPVEYLQDHQPDTFGYPVYHYTQLISVVKGVSFGSTLTVTVTNAQDRQQASRTYLMQPSLSDLDCDGDGLLDTWEDGSYTAPSGNAIPLAAMGTQKWKKDALVEVDWTQVAEPDAAIFARLHDAFAAGPVLNPDGSSGVNLIIDHGAGSLPNGVTTGGGEVLPDHEILAFEDNPPVNGTPVTNFYEYKKNHFDPDRLRIFHYAIFGYHDLQGMSGQGERFGNDFYVTLADHPSSNDADAQVGTFMHELGHNLGLTHGDLNASNAQSFFMFKPNLPSVMNYRYTFTGVDTDCDLIQNGLYSYSQGTLKSLVEAAVDENLGICDKKPLDLGAPSGISVGADIDGANGTRDVWDDFDQWGQLLLDFHTSTNFDD
jgi:hypothetical protein